MPVAIPLSAAFRRTSGFRTLPRGRPMKIVTPARAPSTRICVELKSSAPFPGCKVCLTRRQDYSGSEPAAQHLVEQMARHSVDDYLETIYFLAFPIGEYRPATGSSAIASRVAEMLGVSRASAGEMLKRLEADGLVERGEQKEAILTEAGIVRAERVVRKHRLIERFLTDFMGYTPAESHVHADELGDTFSDDMVERINERLGKPDRCPHGWPVDPVAEQSENRELVALSEVEPGRAAEIVRLAEHDGDLLHWFYDEGLVPGAKVEVREAHPAAGELKVAVGGGERAIAEKAAQGLYVRPAAA